MDDNEKTAILLKLRWLRAHIEALIKATNILNDDALPEGERRSMGDE